MITAAIDPHSELTIKWLLNIAKRVEAGELTIIGSSLQTGPETTSLFVRMSVNAPDSGSAIEDGAGGGAEEE